MITHALPSSEIQAKSPIVSRFGAFKERFAQTTRQVFSLQPIKKLLAHMEQYGSHLVLSKRMMYVPLTAALLLFYATNAEAQCCGGQPNLEVGLRVSKTTNYTDFLTKWTNDGITREINGSFHQGIFKTEFGLGNGRLGQTQDSDNTYKGDFLHATGRVMFAGSSDRRFIPYAGIQGGYIHSEVVGIYAGIPYEYSGGRAFLGRVVGADINIGDAFTLGIGADSRYFLNDPDRFEGIIGGKNPDSQGKGPYPGHLFVVARHRFAL